MNLVFEYTRMMVAILGEGMVAKLREGCKGKLSWA